MGRSKSMLPVEDSASVPEFLVIEQKSDRDILIEKLKAKKIELSFSSLKAFSISPKHFIDYKLKKYDTQSMNYGSLSHLLLLEEQKFEETYEIVKKAPTTDIQVNFCEQIINGATKEEAYSNCYKTGNVDKIYTELEDYIKARKSGKTIVDQPTYDLAKQNVDYLKQQPLIDKFLQALEDVEVDIRWKFEKWKLRGFIDAKGHGFKVDFKFLADASLEKLERAIVKDKYYMQAGMYEDGDPEKDVATRYFVIAADRKNNFSVVEIDRTFIQYGKREYRYLIKKLDECIRDNRFNESYNFFDVQQRTLYKPKYLKGFETDNEEE